MTDQPPKLRHRWFQFSLRTLLIAVTLVAGLLVAWRVYVDPYRRQRETMALIKDVGGSYKTESGGPAWMRVWFGADNFQDILLVDLADCDDPDKYIEQVTSLPRLETLVVGGRAFTDEHLSRLERMATLNGLVLDSTDVSDDGIGALKQTMPELAVHKSHRRSIVALEQLGTVSTELCGALPELRRLVGDEYFRHATQVTLVFFNVIDADVAHLKGLTKLQTLVLVGTQVSDAQLAHLKGLTNLQVLHLFSTQVSDAGLKHLNELVNLKGLNLFDTQVSDAGLKHLNGLMNLKALNLDSTQVSDAGLVHLEGLTNLRELFFDGTKVSDAGLVHLEGLMNLWRLELGGTQVSDAGLAHLKGLANLRLLVLYNTKVTDAGLAHLGGLQNLQELDLCDTQVSDAGVKELQQSLPNCKIRH